jgi:hypothetical protein
MQTLVPALEGAWRNLPSFCRPNVSETQVYLLSTILEDHRVAISNVRQQGYHQDIAHKYGLEWCQEEQTAVPQ